MSKMKDKTIRIKTTDDWCSNYNVDEVELSIINIGSESQPEYRVCVWGADDLGMEKDFSSTELKEAILLFEKLESEGMVSICMLSNLGFIST